MASGKSNANPKVFLSNFIVLVLIVLVVALAFFSGTLWTKVKNPEVSKDGTENQESKKITLADLPEIVKGLRIKEKDYKNCLDSGKYTEKVAKQKDSATRIGVNFTPAIVLLNKQSNLAVLIPGAFPYENFKAFIDALLAEDAKEGQVLYEVAERNIKVSIAKIEKLEPLSEDEHIRGNKDAPIALVEYSDYECPYCQFFHITGKKLIQDYGDKVFWVYRHLPIEQSHPESPKKAEAAECVAELAGNDAFWSFSDTLYE